MTKGILR